MNSRTKRDLCISGIATVLFGAGAPAAFASGFQIQEQTASGLGIAYSGMAAAAQDAGTVFWNPAGMALRPGAEVASSISYIGLGGHFQDAGSTYAALGNGGNVGVAAIVPAFYAAMAVDPRFSVGLALNAPYGLTTQWNSTWAGMFRAIRSHIDTLNINPGFSFKVNDILSVGAGVSYQRLRAVFTQAVTPLIPTAQGRLDGTDWAWGWNAGAVANFDTGTRVGVTYRSTVNYTINGNLGFNNPSLSALDSTVRTSLRLPYTASIGLSQQIDPKLRVLADWTLTGWNSVRALDVVGTGGAEAGKSVVSDTLDFRNSWRAGLGAEYQLQPSWLLRIGIAHDLSPVVTAYRTPLLPDNNRKWLALGARYQPTSHWWVDLGFAHLWVSNMASQLALSGSPTPSSLIGTYDPNINIAAIQGSYHF